MKPRAGVALLLAGGMVTAACSTASSDSPQDGADTAVSSTVAAALEEKAPTPAEGDESTVNEPLPTTPPLSTDRTYDGDTYPTELTGLVTGAVADLADRLGVEVDSILVGAVEEVVWPNGGLGCPLPDMKYTQVPVDGLRIVLIHEGAEYEYHSGGSVEPILCLPESAKGTAGQSSDQGAPSGEDGGSTEGTLELETTVPPDESVPTEQPGGPGGEPDV